MAPSRRRLDRAAQATTEQVNGGRGRYAERREFPDIVTFVTSSEYLGLRVYPRQLLILKLLFLQVGLLTALDRQVLKKWCAGFTKAADHDGDHAVYQGGYGVAPDILERIERLRAEGRLWFRDVVAVIGRRGSKGFLGAIAFAYILYWYVWQDDPHARLNIVPTKMLSMVVFAGNKAQAVANQFGDIVRLITRSACFDRYRAEPTSDELRLFTHSQVASGRKPTKLEAAIAIVASEATPNGVRGRTAIGIALDEAAHMIPGGANRPASEIWNAATPALGQCGPQGMYGFAWQASSPWAMVDLFYESYINGLSYNTTTGAAIAYDTFVVQLPSWDLYEDYELTQSGDLEMYPGGPCFEPIAEPVIAYDERLQRDEALDPDTFAVEYRAQFTTSPDRYLPADAVNAIFAPWPDQPLQIQTAGILANDYHAHADPSSVNDNYAFVIAHSQPNDTPIPDIVFDVIQHWEPNQFREHKIDYLVVEAELARYLDAFGTTVEFSMDQHNSHGTLQRIASYLRQQHRPARTQVTKVTNTQATKLEKYEVSKKLALMGRIHAPAYELARLELLFLRRIGDKIDHHNVGPCTTNDIADAMIEVVYRLVDPSALLHADLSNFRLGAALQEGVTEPESHPFGPNPYAGQLTAAGRLTPGFGARRGRRGGGGRPRWNR